MKIAFVTTLSQKGSTVAGRVMPLAREIGKMGHEVEVLGLRSISKVEMIDSPIKSANDNKTAWHTVGREPFERTKNGKKRSSGLALVFQLLSISFKTAVTLYRLKPDAVVIVKSLPHNVLGVWLWSWLRRPKKIIVDADDFELTANRVTSIWQRAAIHWAERCAVSLADVIVTATPFLNDHFLQLSRGRKPVHMIPTGIEAADVVEKTPLSPPYQGENVLAHAFGYVGSMSVGSGHRVDWLPEILEIISQKYSDVKLIMAGSGDDIEGLKKEFARRYLDNKVEWLGRFSDREVDKILSKIGVMVDPVDGSITNRAKSSYRVMLAAAAGLPVVTSNIGIRPELLPRTVHGRCFARPSDATDYADKILDIFNQPFSQEDREALLEHAEQFYWEKLVKRYIEVIR